MTKKDEKFASIHANYTKKANIAQMYDIIYDEAVDARMASMHVDPVITDRAGNVVEEILCFGSLSAAPSPK